MPAYICGFNSQHRTGRVVPVYSRVRRERKEVISHRAHVRSGRLQKMEIEDNRGNRVRKCCAVFNLSTENAEAADLFEFKAILAYK